MGVTSYGARSPTRGAFWPMSQKGRGPTENRELLPTIGVPNKSPTLFPKPCYHSCMSRHANTRSPSPPKRGRPEKASPMLHPELAPGLKKLVPQALAVLEDVLNRRKGDRVALTAAQWLVETVATEPLSQEDSPAGEEMGVVLEMLRGGQ